MDLSGPSAALVFSVREWDGDYFSRDMPGGVETTKVRSALWCIRTEGGGRVRVPTSGSRAEHPVASPDGRWLYWQEETDGRWRICRSRVDGTERSVVAPVTGRDKKWTSAYGAALARGGTHLTCTVSDGVTGRVWLAKADGSDARVLAEDFGYAYMAAPDASAGSVVFSGPAQGYRLAMVAAAGGQPRVLTPDQPDSYVPQFTPDGQAIIFINRDGRLYRIATDGTDLRCLADGVQVEFFLSPQDEHGSTDFPSIAPDGRRVAFIRRDRNGVPQVALVDCDGGHLHEITHLPGACARVSWSPDGRRLAFVSMVNGYPQPFMVPGDGHAAPVQVMHEKGAVYALSWLPASS